MFTGFVGPERVYSSDASIFRRPYRSRRSPEADGLEEELAIAVREIVQNTVNSALSSHFLADSPPSTGLIANQEALRPVDAGDIGAAIESPYPRSSTADPLRSSDRTSPKDTAVQRDGEHCLAIEWPSGTFMESQNDRPDLWNERYTRSSNRFVIPKADLVPVERPSEPMDVDGPEYLRSVNSPNTVYPGEPMDLDIEYPDEHTKMLANMHTSINNEVSNILSLNTDQFDEIYDQTEPASSQPSSSSLEHDKPDDSISLLINDGDEMWADLTAAFQAWDTRIDIADINSSVVYEADGDVFMRDAN